MISILSIIITERIFEEKTNSHADYNRPMQSSFPTKAEPMKGYSQVLKKFLDTKLQFSPE